MKHRKKHLGLAAETGKGHSARRDAISGGSDDGQKRVTESPASTKQLPPGFPAPTWAGNVSGGSLARGPQAAAAPKVKFRAPTCAGKISGGSARRGRKSPAAPKVPLADNVPRANLVSGFWWGLLTCCSFGGSGRKSSCQSFPGPTWTGLSEGGSLFAARTPGDPTSELPLGLRTPI